MSSSPGPPTPPRRKYPYEVERRGAASPERIRQRKAESRERKREAERLPVQREAAWAARQVQAIADQCPTLKAEFNEFLYLLNQRTAERPDRVRDSVLHMLRHSPACSMEDFLDELKFSELIITSVLDALRALGVVEETPQPGRPHNDGAPPMVWRLTGQKPSTPDVLP